MKSFRTPLTTALLFLLALGCAHVAFAADDPAQFRLTSALLDKIDAIQAEARKPAKSSDEDEDEDDDEDDEGSLSQDLDIPTMIRKLESNPEHRALLAKHGVTAREMALSVHAVLHAGAFLTFEPTMDKQGAQKLYNGYTAAQKANIELLRQRLAKAGR